MTFAVLFPGQGSQSVGMLANLAESFPDINTTFEEATDILGRDLWKLSRQGPAIALSDTPVTQPLMFTSGVAVWRALRTAGLPMPVAVAGHSLGEFVALVATGSLSFADGLKLVQRRANLMAEAVPPGEGGMAALIGMEDDTVDELCQRVNGERVIEAVNFNAPGQVAISGHVDAMQKVIDLAKEHGCRKALTLAVSVPNHSSLMRDAGAELAGEIDQLEFSEPQVPLLQNATAEAANSLSTMLERLKSHVFSPVYWTRTIRNLKDNHGVSTLIEAGPGKVLTGLSRRIDKTLPTLPVDTAETLQQAIAAVTHQKRERSDMSGQLTGQIALVTGASRGIGAAISDCLAAAGATVIGTATTESGAQAIGDRLGASGTGQVLNVTDAANCEQCLAGITEQYGPVSILVNNAGITRDNLFMRMKEDDWDAVIATNLTAVFRLCRLVVKPMVKARSGRIINISSVVGITGNAGQVNYAAAKAGLLGMTKSLAREFGSRSITVNAIAPGFIESDMTDALPDATKEQLKSEIALGRFGTPEDIAQTCLFLSSAAAAYITGQTISVNGGMVMT